MKRKNKHMEKRSDREAPQKYGLDQLLAKSPRGAFDLTAEDYRWLDGLLIEGRTKHS
jgi:hypothetical protein